MPAFISAGQDGCDVHGVLRWDAFDEPNGTSRFPSTRTPDTMHVTSAVPGSFRAEISEEPLVVTARTGLEPGPRFHVRAGCRRVTDGRLGGSYGGGFGHGGRLVHVVAVGEVDVPRTVGILAEIAPVDGDSGGPLAVAETHHITRRCEQAEVLADVAGVDVKVDRQFLRSGGTEEAKGDQGVEPWPAGLFRYGRVRAVPLDDLGSVKEWATLVIERRVLESARTDEATNRVWGPVGQAASLVGGDESRLIWCHGRDCTYG